MTEFRYSFFGSTLRTPIPFHTLPGPPPEDAGSHEVTLRIGDVPAGLKEPVWSSPFITLATDGQALVQIPAVGRFLVTGGSEIRVQRQDDATETAVQSILLSIVAGVLLHQRDALPLHASCVEFEGKCYAFAGPSGRGKSTLAAAMVARGARLISDDISVVTSARSSYCVVQGGLGLRLWPDAIEAAGVGEDWTPVRPEISKRVSAVDLGWHPPAPLHAIIRLETANPATPAGWRLLQGPTAVAPIGDLVYRFTLGKHLGRFESLFVRLTRLAERVPVFELRRPKEPGALDETVALFTELAARV